jgi:hypothetical protein
MICNVLNGSFFSVFFGIGKVVRAAQTTLAGSSKVKILQTGTEKARPF